MTLYLILGVKDDMYPDDLQHNAAGVCHAIELCSAHDAIGWGEMGCGMPFFFHASWTYTVIVLLWRVKWSPSLLGGAKPEVMVCRRLNNYNPSAYHLCILHGQIHTLWQDTYAVLHTLLHILLFWPLLYPHAPTYSSSPPQCFTFD